MGAALAILSVLLLLGLFGILIGGGYALMHDYPLRWIIAGMMGGVAVLAAVGFLLWA
jgi:hypothetical protein